MNVSRFLETKIKNEPLYDKNENPISGWMQSIDYPFAFLPKIIINNQEIVNSSHLWCSLCKRWVSLSTTSHNWIRHCNLCMNKKGFIGSCIKRFFLQNGLPFLLIEDEELQQVFPFLPCRQALTQQIISIANNMNEAIKVLIQQASEVTISLDEWADASNRRYIGATIFIYKELDVQKIDLPLQIVKTIRLRAKDIFNIFQNLVNEYSLNGKIKVVSTDTCNTMICVANNLLSIGISWMPCICHILNLFINSFMNALDDELEDIFEFHSKWVRSTPLTTFLLQTQCPIKKIPKDCDVRWTSYSRVINSLITVFPYIDAFCCTQNAPEPDPMILAKLQCIQKLFIKHEKAILELESEAIGSITKILYHIKRLLEEIKSLPDYFIAGKQAFLSIYNEKWLQYQKCWDPILYIACYLNPRLNWEAIIGESNIIKVKSWIISQAKEDMQSDIDESEPGSDVYLANIHNQQHNIEWEINCYETYRQFINTKDIDEFWRDIDLPILKKIAINIIRIQVTSAPTERLFSCAGNIIGKKRTKLSSKALTAATFIKSNPEIAKKFIE